MSLTKEEYKSLIVLLVECKNSERLQNSANLSYLECINLGNKLEKLRGAEE